MAGGIENIARAVICHNGKILLCQAKGKSHYFLPGGHVEMGETIHQALRREIEEELGEQVRIQQFMGVVENFYGSKVAPRHEINYLFATELENMVVASREKHLHFVWVKVERLHETPLLPFPVKELLLDWWNNQKIFWSAVNDSV